MAIRKYSNSCAACVHIIIMQQTLYVLHNTDNYNNNALISGCLSSWQLKRSLLTQHLCGCLPDLSELPLTQHWQQTQHGSKHAALNIAKEEREEWMDC